MRVSEIFYSLQGEGSTIGRPAIFVRFVGCNLSCKWCDSKYAWKDGEMMSIDEVVESIRKFLKDFKCNRIVFTGGEPLLVKKEIVTIIKKLSNIKNIEIETNGTLLPGDLAYLKNIKWNISPKLSNSGIEKSKRIIPSVIKSFLKLPCYEFKFVVSKAIDILEVKKFVGQFHISKEHIYLMPEGKDKTSILSQLEMLTSFCKLLGYSLTPRLHVLTYGNRRGV